MKKRFVSTVGFIVVSALFLSGCASFYTSILREEFRRSGRVDGVYYGESEYPSLYHSTRIALTIEVPSWWWFSDSPIYDDYKLCFWPIGAILSLCDVPCSLITDTAYLYIDIKAKKRDNR